MFDNIAQASTSKHKFSSYVICVCMCVCLLYSLHIFLQETFSSPKQFQVLSFATDASF